MNRRRAACLLSLVLSLGLVSAAAPSSGISAIKQADLEEWLSYVASDALEGRATYSSGLGLAAGYIESHLRRWGVTPGGDDHAYLQTVHVLGVKTTSRSSVTVQVGKESRTFQDGAEVTFPKNSGRKRAVTVRRVEFVGYGVHAAHHADYRGKNVADTAVVWLGLNGPLDLNSQYRRVLNGRSRYATEQRRARAAIGPQAVRPGANPTTAQPTAARAPGTADGERRGGLPTPDFTTTQRLDHDVPPMVSASDAFFTFLFSSAPTEYEELKRKADAQEALPDFRLDGVTITFNIDADYEIVRTQRTQNVIGIVEGIDPRLKKTYVAFGAHYDHVGYADAEVTSDGSRRPGAPGRVTPGAVEDRIWNGADDDGSGTVALMAMAKALAEGSRPKRSVLFVWHAGEERGLLGSRYFADHPTVPIDGIVAQLNLDMIGRNRDDRAAEGNTVYLVGSDRISSELHEINREANRALPAPLTLDYEMNDPADLEQVYFRSDHYSYAAKGIPVIFFTTGLHADYHANTDHVSKIEFAKMTRIVQLVYETGWRVANLEHAPTRDNKGPRAGKGTR